jgi:hypothetical protein
MNINEFLNHRKNCLVCDHRNIVLMSGKMTEIIGDSENIHSIFRYMLPVLRKDFLTFAVFNLGILPRNPDLDLETFDNTKYSTFVLRKDGYVSFDKDFQFKMKLTFSAECPNGHYSYNSRLIRVSNKSPDITKGFPVITEELTCNNYKVISNSVENTTSVFNFEKSKEPIVMPYKDISTFPYDDEEKFIKKVENILLLG